MGVSLHLLVLEIQELLVLQLVSLFAAQFTEDWPERRNSGLKREVQTALL